MNGYQKFLKRLILSDNWRLASKNIDDDLHTDILFLRSSCGNISEVTGNKHSSTIHISNGFTTEFYYKVKEDNEFIETLVSKFLSDKNWRQFLISGIEDSVKKLSEFWDDVTLEGISKMSNDSIIEIYEGQLELHMNVYKFAWTAEALMADGHGVTGRPISLLKEKGLKRGELFMFLNTLIDIGVKSLVEQEEEDIRKLAHEIFGGGYYVETLLKDRKYLKFYLLPRHRKMIDELVTKYSYFGYHGFNDMTPYNENHYLNKIVNCDLSRQTLPSKKVSVDKVNSIIDEDEKEIFEDYGRLGILKLDRRMAQLKNFYYLDKIISTIARRLDVPEAIIRFMTPEEIVRSIREGALDKNKFINRPNLLVYIYHTGKEYILSGDHAVKAKEDLSKQVEGKNLSFSGVPTSLGKAKGKVVVAIRNDKYLEARFRDGDILVGLETDPDLIPIIKKAGAVVTEQGGITSHAAIVTRELGIPCLTGVSGITDILKDGDYIFVDAVEGFIQVLSDTDSESNILQKEQGGEAVIDIGVERLRNRIEILGGKAEVLSRLKSANFPVPDGFVISEKLLKNSEFPAHAIESRIRQDVKWAVRSSASTEDLKSISSAGRFETFLNVPSSEVVGKVQLLMKARKTSYDLLEENFYLNVLVMPMQEFDVSGVVFTYNPVSRKHEFLVETVEGLADKLVGGLVQPKSVVINSEQIGDSHLSPNQLRTLIKTVKKIKDFLAIGEIDVEFGFVGKKLTIIQARPLTTK